MGIAASDRRHRCKRPWASLQATVGIVRDQPQCAHICVKQPYCTLEDNVLNMLVIYFLLLILKAQTNCTPLTCTMSANFVDDLLRSSGVAITEDVQDLADSLSDSYDSTKMLCMSLGLTRSLPDIPAAIKGLKDAGVIWDESSPKMNNVVRALLQAATCTLEEDVSVQGSVKRAKRAGSLE